MGDYSKVHTRAVNELESHLNYIHFILLYFFTAKWSVPANITLHRSIRIFNLHGHWTQRIHWVGHVVLQDGELSPREGAVLSQISTQHTPLS